MVEVKSSPKREIRRLSTTEIWVGKTYENDRVMEPWEDRVERHGEEEATCSSTLPGTSGHEEVSSGYPCKLNLRSAVVKKKKSERIDK